MNNRSIQAIIILLIIILTWLLYQQYLEEQEINKIILWEVQKSYLTFLKLKNIFGDPTPIEIDKVLGAMWGKNGLFKKIILLDQENNSLIISILLELFAGFENVQITKEAIYHKLCQITNLSENICYDRVAETATMKCNSWEEALAKVILLTKLSTSELSIKEVRKQDLLSYYKNYARNEEKKIYEELDEYYKICQFGRISPNITDFPDDK